MISSEKQNALEQKMAELQIKEEDLQEEFIKGSGAGGQKINKTSSTVLLTHLPSQISVRCQKTRSQSLNRFWARRILVDKLESILSKEKSALQQRIEKLRRQKRKRSKRAQEKVLQSKHFQSAKKELRKPPRD